MLLYYSNTTNIAITDFVKPDEGPHWIETLLRLYCCIAILKNTMQFISMLVCSLSNHAIANSCYHYSIDNY